MEKRTNFKEIREGDLMAVVKYAKVVNKGFGELGMIDVDNGETFGVQGISLAEQLFSADRYEQEKVGTKTGLAQILVSSHNRPFTVVFEKSNGEERKLRGRLIKPEPLLGRSQVEDLDIEDEPAKRFRMVDHRTLLSIIVDGTRYVLKGRF